ncbi:TPA: hypothetical protein JLG79_004577 [Escherichia coli]|nr:hypothetical protein [Escherichia coli]HAV9637083.1 hypothetical protein [Escherichia coli]HAV9655596.1 hypothetical protein [Escherichia coli]HDL9614903.1 hypothetical protein [Escherichia coli]
MGESKIIHGDLNTRNILFDEKNNRFWPIDFSNSYEHYYSLDKDSKLFVNEMANIKKFAGKCHKQYIEKWYCRHCLLIFSRHISTKNSGEKE